MTATLTTPIERFTDEYRWLSNFWDDGVAVILDGLFYRSVEAAYQAAKSLDPEYRARVRACRTPGAAKRVGRTGALRSDWYRVRDEVMLDLVRQKFSPGTALGERLVGTGDAELIEGNTWGDRYWGVSGGRGQNRLGVILMQVRDELRAY